MLRQTISVLALVALFEQFAEAAFVELPTPPIAPTIAFFTTFLALFVGTGAVINWHRHQPHNFNAALNNIARYMEGTPEQRQNLLREVAKLKGWNNRPIPLNISGILNVTRITEFPEAAFLAAASRWQDAWDKLNALREESQKARTTWQNYRDVMRLMVADPTRLPADASDDALQSHAMDHVNDLTRYHFEQDPKKVSSSKPFRDLIEQFRTKAKNLLELATTEFTLDFFLDEVLKNIVRIREALEVDRGNLKWLAEKIAERRTTLSTILGTPDSWVEMRDELRKHIPVIQALIGNPSMKIGEIRNRLEKGTALLKKITVGHRGSLVGLHEIIQHAEISIKRLAADITDTPFQNVSQLEKETTEIKTKISNVTGRFVTITEGIQDLLKNQDLGELQNLINEDTTVSLPNLVSTVKQLLERLEEAVGPAAHLEDAINANKTGWDEMKMFLFTNPNQDQTWTTLTAFMDASMTNLNEALHDRKDAFERIPTKLEDLRSAIGAELGQQPANLLQIPTQIIDIREKMEQALGLPRSDPLAMASMHTLLNTLKRQRFGPATDWNTVARELGATPFEMVTSLDGLKAWHNKHFIRASTVPAPTAPIPSTPALAPAPFDYAAFAAAMATTREQGFSCKDDCPTPMYSGNCDDLLDWEKQMKRALAKLWNNTSTGYRIEARRYFVKSLCQDSYEWYESNQMQFDGELTKAIDFGSAIMALINVFIVESGIDRKQLQRKAQYKFNCTVIKASCWLQFWERFSALRHEAGIDEDDASVIPRLLYMIPDEHEQELTRIARTRNLAHTAENLDLDEIRQAMRVIWKKEPIKAAKIPCGDTGCKNNFTDNICPCEKPKVRTISDPQVSAVWRPKRIQEKVGTPAHQNHTRLGPKGFAAFNRFKKMIPGDDPDVEELRTWLRQHGICTGCWQVSNAETYGAAFPDDPEPQ